VRGLRVLLDFGTTAHLGDAGLLQLHLLGEQHADIAEPLAQVGRQPARDRQVLGFLGLAGREAHPEPGERGDSSRDACVSQQSASLHGHRP
jgi:hypothetical protein